MTEEKKPKKTTAVKDVKKEKKVEPKKVVKVEAETEPKKESVPSEPSFKGKYISTIGRRKTSTARVRLFKNGKGAIMVNGVKLSKYFSADKVAIANQSLKTVGLLRDVDVSVVVSGGGTTGQAEAIRHGISRALIEMDIELRPTLKARGWITRDDRKVERKKPGLKKARKAPQWSKR